MTSPFKVAPADSTVSKPPFEVPIKFTKLYINGEFVNSQDGATFEVVNPTTGKTIASVTEAGPADVDIAVKAARKAYEDVWRHTSGSVRGEMMWKLADLMEEHQDVLAGLDSIDNGKAFYIAKYVDIAACIKTIRYYAGWATKIQGKTIYPEGGYNGYTRHEPIGVVGCIIPWNFPMLMAIWKMGPLLACGNTAVLKSSEKTPLSILYWCSLLELAGFPKGVVNVLSGFGPRAGDALARHMDVDKIAFTGSTAVGRHMLRAAADSNLKKVTVELGGKSPVIVFPDANIANAVAGVASGIFFNAGQVCCAGSRVYVHESIHAEFVAALTKVARETAVSGGGGPLVSNAGGALQPVVDSLQFARVSGYLAKGAEEGATVAAGGKPNPGDGYYIPATVFTDVTDNMTIAREEIFGPVLSVLKFSTIEEAINRANDSPYGLAASVWTDDINKANFCAANIRAGTVWINCHNALHYNMPFGGYKASGMGRDLGEYAIQEYCQVKSVITSAPPASGLAINIHARS